MANRSNSHAPLRRAFILPLALGLLLTCFATPGAQACPFCVALEPTLCQRREQATVTALAEVLTRVDDKHSKLQVHRVFSGEASLAQDQPLTLALDASPKPGSLVILFGEESAAKSPADWNWKAVPANEIVIAYFAKAPSLKTPTAERLRYFARYLEHADAQIAADAYLEFGHAPFDEVSQVTEAIPAERLRAWLLDPAVPAGRKGLYGMLLGLHQGNVRADNAEFLQNLILQPEDDFRAGFDGILGGYLQLTGDRGLELLEERYLDNPRAADGDLRHLHTALRFYHEHGDAITPERLNRALRKLLARPEFAEAAITDLARWQDWEALAQIVPLYNRQAFQTPSIRRAIVGYLLTCPERFAAEALAQLRQADPDGVAAAERILSQTSSLTPGDR